MTITKPALLIAVVITVTSHLPGEDKASQVYPLHGTVLAMHTEVRSGTTPVYTDPYGKTHGGGSTHRREHIYTVQASDMIYDIEGRPPLSINEQIIFRVQKDKVFVQRGDKEVKYFLAGQSARTPEAPTQH